MDSTFPHNIGRGSYVQWRNGDVILHGTVQRTYERAFHMRYARTRDDDGRYHSVNVEELRPDGPGTVTQRPEGLHECSDCPAGWPCIHLTAEQRKHDLAILQARFVPEGMPF